MEHPGMKKITGGLIGLCILLLICDLLLLPLTPAMAYFRLETAAEVGLDGLLSTFEYDFDDGLGNLVSILLIYAWRNPHTAVTSAFLLLCGICAAVLLLQAIRVLEHLSVGEIFFKQKRSQSETGGSRQLCDLRRGAGADSLYTAVEGNL